MQCTKTLLALLITLAGTDRPAPAAGQQQPGSPEAITRAVDDVVAEKHYARALELIAAGKTSEAKAQFQSAWEREPAEGRYVHGLAEFYITHHEFDQALNVLRDYVKRRGANALGYTLQGELLFEQERFDLAYESLQRALELSYNNNYRAHELIGLLDVVRRRDVDALEELRTAAQQQPTSAQVRYFYGRMCYLNGRYPDARNEFLECLKLQPAYPGALENLGLCYEALRDNARAGAAYQRAIELDKAGKTPPSDDPYVDYGAFLAAGGRIDEAIPILREGLERDPDSARANFELGRVILATGKDDEAEKLLLRATGLDPGFSRPHYLLGRIYQKKNLHDEAKGQFALFERLNAIPENRHARLTGRPHAPFDFGPALQPAPQAHSESGLEP